MRSSNNEPIDLFEGARHLNVDALEEIHDRYYAEVYCYVRYRLNDERICEDITSEVFTLLLDALRRRREREKSVRNWLLKTAAELVNDVLKQHHKHKIGDPIMGNQRTVATIGFPEETWEGVSKEAEIWTAFSRLPAEQQHVLALRFSGQLSLNEMVEIIGKKANDVKALQYSALAALRRNMERKPS